jgi:hypothetical protein
MESESAVASARLAVGLRNAMARRAARLPFRERWDAGMGIGEMAAQIAGA